MFKSTNNFGILNFGGYIRTPFRLILSIYSYFLLYLTFFHKASCKGKKVYKCETSWPEWPELLPGSSPNNNSKVNCPNLGLMRSWRGPNWNQGPLCFATCLLTPPKSFIREQVSPASQTMSSTKTQPVQCCLLQLYICNRGIAPLSMLYLVVLE